MTRACVFVVPGSLDGRTGGYEYDRRIVAGLRQFGWDVDVRELPGTYPRPSPADLDRAAGLLAHLPDRAIVVVDGLAYGAMPDHVAAERSRLRFVALVHMPLGADPGLEPEAAAALRESESRALTCASAIVVTGLATVPLLVRAALCGDRIRVVLPGTDWVPLARGSRGETVHLVTAAPLTTGKGYDVLLRALSRVRPRGWRLTCAGSVEREPATAQRIRSLVTELGLDHQVVFQGELDASRLAALYDAADVFVLATRFETYGMTVAEAVARGLPIVATRTGAIPDLVGEGERAAGIVVERGDDAGLAAALTTVITEPDARARFAAGARARRERLPSWQTAATAFSGVLDAVAV